MIELPKDADGNYIPLDTEVLYDKHGVKFDVKYFRFYKAPSSQEGEWLVSGVFNDDTDDSFIMPKFLCITPPDSWKRLLDDLDKAASKTYGGTCSYFGMNPIDCDMCTIGDVTSCDSAAMRDIADRIRKLRGEGE